MILLFGQCVLLLVLLLVSLAFLLYVDRKVWAAVQMRKGPNVVGPFGLMQSFADFIKFLIKEVIIPAGADRKLFFVAPLITFTFAIMSWAVIPFSDSWVIADINIGIIYLLAVSSLGVYGVIIGGWASNSRYAFLGSLRSAAQMISYEIPIGLVMIAIILSSGSMRLSDIVMSQSGGIANWFLLVHFPMLPILFVCALAETNRPPFDLPEAESELVAGYQVEYSSTLYLLFMIGEYMNIVLMCVLISLFFLGGWLSPVSFIPDGAGWLVIKTFILFFNFAMVKAIVPRYRYDQLMRLSWKGMIPITFAWVVFVSFMVFYDIGFWYRGEL